MKRSTQKHRTQPPAKSLFTLAAVVLLAVLGYFGIDLTGVLSDVGQSLPPLTDASAVHFIDVGQGDSALLLSGTEAVLIDAGTPECGDELVAYLQAQGITELRAVIATHPHADHIGSMAQVIRAFPITEFFMPNRTATTKTYSNMLDALEEKNVAVTVPEPGDSLTLRSGAQFRFLSPSSEASYADTNNYSIVAMLYAGQTRILFTGDAEAEVEETLLRQRADLQCDILKVGHHGSHSSSTPDFLRATGAKTAIISCAAKNDYGHPHAETLKNLENTGFTAIRRTSEEGTIVCNLDTATT